MKNRIFKNILACTNSMMMFHTEVAFEILNSSALNMDDVTWTVTLQRRQNKTLTGFTGQVA